MLSVVRKHKENNRHSIVHLKKEQNLLEIQKKRQIGCQLKEKCKFVVNSKNESINFLRLFYQPMSLKRRKKKGVGVIYSGNLVFFFFGKKINKPDVQLVLCWHLERGGGQTDRQVHRQTGTQTDRHTQTYGHMHTQIHRDTETSQLLHST